MLAIQFIILVLMGTSIIFLSYMIFKSILSPKKIENIQKLIKQGKYPAAIKTAKAILSKTQEISRRIIFWGRPIFLTANQSLLSWNIRS